MKKTPHVIWVCPNSELFFRLSRRDANQMPPIATLVADPVGVDVLRRWIDSLNACP